MCGNFSEISGIWSIKRWKIDIDKPSSGKKDLGKTRKLHDEVMINDCYEVISNWSNPFRVSEELVSINSGISAPVEVVNDLSRAEQVGSSCFETFVNYQLNRRKFQRTSKEE